MAEVPEVVVVLLIQVEVAEEVQEEAPAAVVRVQVHHHQVEDKLTTLKFRNN